ncbi:MAG: glycoside hydrolase family 20 zincin-like fold domain-containing protein, partial [Pirellulales bacterium]
LRAAFQATGRAVGAGTEVVLEVVEGLPAEGYQLTVEAQGIHLCGADAAGLAHGMRTLTQLVEAAESGVLGGVRIEDQPDFPHRGVMLDISRDRVPTMETLFALVDRLASWKFNQLQLYVEHTFAYAGHESVWRGRDPMTAEELRALDDRIELQNASVANSRVGLSSILIGGPGDDSIFDGLGADLLIADSAFTNMNGDGTDDLHSSDDGKVDRLVGKEFTDTFDSLGAEDQDIYTT